MVVVVMVIKVLEVVWVAEVYSDGGTVVMVALLGL